MRLNVYAVGFVPRVIERDKDGVEVSSRVLGPSRSITVACETPECAIEYAESTLNGNQEIHVEYVRELAGNVEIAGAVSYEDHYDAVMKAKAGQIQEKPNQAIGGAKPEPTLDQLLAETETPKPSSKGQS